MQPCLPSLLSQCLQAFAGVFAGSAGPVLFRISHWQSVMHSKQQTDSNTASGTCRHCDSRFNVQTCLQLLCSVAGGLPGSASVSKSAVVGNQETSRTFVCKQGARVQKLMEPHSNCMCGPHFQAGTATLEISAKRIYTETTDEFGSSPVKLSRVELFKMKKC